MGRKLEANAKFASWEEEKRFIRSLMKKGPLKGKRRWKREDLYGRKSFP